MSKLEIKTGAVLFCTLALLLGGCGKDRTVDDWKNEKTMQDLAKIQAVSGTYSGLIYSNSAGNVTRLDDGAMGALAVDLRADTRLKDGSDRTAVLKGKVTYVSDGQTYFASATNGVYDDYNKTFQLDIPLGNLTVSLSGTISSGQMKGKLAADIYDESGGTFQLTKNAPLPEVRPDPNRNPNLRDALAPSYSGKTIYPSGASGEIKMNILERSKTSDMAFLDRFIPLKYYDFSIEIDHTITFVFFAAEWDQRRHRMSAVTTGSSGGYDYKIVFNCDEQIVDDKLAWNCLWQAAQGSTFRVLLKPSKIGV